MKLYIISLFFITTSLKCVVVPFVEFAYVVDQAADENDETAAKVAAAIYPSIDPAQKQAIERATKKWASKFKAKKLEDYLPKPIATPLTGDTTLDSYIAKKEYEKAFVYILEGDKDKEGVGLQVAKNIKGTDAHKAAKKFYEAVKAS